MSAIPALCQSCGLLFPSGFATSPNGAAHLHGCSTSCPRCVAPVQVAGLYRYADGVLREISGLDPTILKQLLAAIQTGRAQGKRDEDIAEEIKKLPVPSDFVPRNPQDLSLYLTIILTLITLWLSRCDSSGAQSVINNDIQITIVNETLESMSQQGTEKSEQQIIWINDLTRESPTVAERSFHNVVIRGPAVVAFLDGCVLDDCTFDTGGSTDQRSLVWQSLNPKGGVGIVALKRCRFAQCRFVGIGVTGAQDDIEAFLRNVKVR